MVALVAQKTVTCQDAGLYTDVLDNPVTLTAGTTFAVTYEYNTADDVLLMVSLSYDTMYGTTQELAVNYIEPGQSFLLDDGNVWNDMYDYGEGVRSNYRLHAYTALIDDGDTSEPVSEPTSEPVSETSETPSDPSDPWIVSEDDEFSQPSDPESTDVPSEVPSDPTSEPVSDRPEVPGDADGDGEVTMKDVLLARKLIAGMDAQADRDALDVDGDGQLTMKDVLLLRKFIAGMITSFER